MLRNTMHNSVGANVAAKLPRLNTKVNAGYKWVSGQAVCAPSLRRSTVSNGTFLHVGVRQALPKFAPALGSYRQLR